MGLLVFWGFFVWGGCHSSLEVHAINLINLISSWLHGQVQTLFDTTAHPVWKLLLEERGLNMMTAFLLCHLYRKMLLCFHRLSFFCRDLTCFLSK